MCYLLLTYSIGLTLFPSFTTSKWRCGPVLNPVEPLSAMIMILTFYQLAVEIYAYGFIAKNNDYREKESTAKVLTLKGNHKAINIENINVNSKTKVINKKNINVNNFVLKKPVKGGITTSGFGDTIQPRPLLPLSPLCLY